MDLLGLVDLTELIIEEPIGATKLASKLAPIMEAEDQSSQLILSIKTPVAREELLLGRVQFFLLFQIFEIFLKFF
jgi:hypothetical protein